MRRKNRIRGSLKGRRKRGWGDFADNHERADGCVI